MTDLFPAPAPVPPMAEALRPRSLDEFVGQQHLLGPGKPLRLAFDSGKPHSMILWGPPGVGKTTLARLMADAFDAQFIALSAVFSGVKDIKDAVRRGAGLTRQLLAPSPEIPAGLDHAREHAPDQRPFGDARSRFRAQHLQRRHAVCDGATTDGQHTDPDSLAFLTGLIGGWHRGLFRTM